MQKGVVRLPDSTFVGTFAGYWVVGAAMKMRTFTEYLRSGLVTAYTVVAIVTSLTMSIDLILENDMEGTRVTPEVLE